jgi:pyruvate-formate lyase-activating enzyme
MKKIDFEILINDNFRRMSRILRKSFVETKAFLSGKRFYCSALAGQSSYNICVNCDMTISCNCRDYDGTGHIGDLHVNTLEEIFASEISSCFRRTLAGGKLPILTCASCPELHLTNPEQAVAYIDNYDLPTRGLMVENTISCNYRCSGCSRNEVMKTRKRKAMSLEDIKIISSMIRTHRITKIEFYNLGEPFCYPGIFEQLNIIRTENPTINIAMSTNGVLLDNDEKRKAALLCDHLCFSIDGIDDMTLQKYQRGGDFEKAYKNMKKLVDYRNQFGLEKPTIEWKYLLFNWNDKRRMILKAVEMAKEANIDIVSFWPTRMPVYGISWRYYLDGFYKNIGVVKNSRHEIYIRKIQPELPPKTN